MTGARKTKKGVSQLPGQRRAQKRGLGILSFTSLARFREKYRHLFHYRPTVSYLQENDPYPWPAPDGLAGAGWYP